MAKTTPLRNLLGNLPFTAEIDWMFRQRNRPRKDHFNLDRLQKSLPAAVAVVEPIAKNAKPGKKVLFFATLHYWIEQSAYLGLSLACLGHKVTLLTLPYAEWHKQKDNFTQRQRTLHTRDALSSLSSLIEHASLLDPSIRSGRRLRPAAALPDILLADVKEISLWDAQYTLMREEVDMNDAGDRALYDLRIQRNTFAAKAALEWMQTKKPDVILIPNGLILEMGIVFRVARYLNIDAVTYEFNDQREQIWIAQNSSIMKQDTDYIVDARCHLPMTDEMFERVADLENARRGARVWGKSKRLWQYVSSQGAQETRKMLGLDNRPVVMLAANVLGDSLTLGRDIFAASMTEWITKTVQYFARRTDVQMVIRVHPGEKFVPQAKSMGAVVREALPELPSHIHIIGALDNINTYDLIEIADVGLAYTTTVGLETAMNSRPVISCGETHYRGRGFTLDPNSWDEYYATLEKVLADIPAYRLNEKQTEFAWNYAYRFFFEYPRPFPWRLMNFWDDLETWPLEKVLSEAGMAQFKDTFDFLVNEPFTWKNLPQRKLLRGKKKNYMTNETKQKVREFYDEIGWQQEEDGLYQNARYEDLRPVSREYIHKTRLRVLNGIISTGNFILDAGSGPVQYEEYKAYSQGYQKRVCLDISIQALREARERIGDHGLFVVGDLANLPFKPESFDGAVSMHAIHHLALTEHLRAYSEIHRVLASGRTAAIVNGWHEPFLSRMAEPLIGLMRKLSGRAEKKKKEWLNEEGATGTFVQKMTPEWLKREIGSKMIIEIKPWRSVSTRALRWFVRPFGGRMFLKCIFWLEGVFPKFFAENGQYPLIVVKK